METWSDAVSAFRAKDKAEALRIFCELAKRGEIAAYLEIGNIYELGGDGVIQDFDAAMRWYKKSLFKAEDIDACLGVARLYYFGKGRKIDYQKALSYYALLENSNDPIASFMMGKMYQLGQGVEKDMNKAEAFYEKAAREGNLFALRNLGILRCHKGKKIAGSLLFIKAILHGLLLSLFSPKSRALRSN